MAQPIFETRRLILHPRTLADTDACIAMDREPGVARFIPEILSFVSGPAANPDAHRAFVEARTRGPYPAGLGYWTIRPRSGADGFLGWVMLIPLDAVGPDIEIGWRLHPAAWRQGYAGEAAGPLLRHGLADLRLPEIVADIDPANLASVRVAEKIGMRRSTPEPPSGQTSIRFALTREEFDRREIFQHVGMLPP
jgi:RimJ/RimL family protein N-acetyltransferase